MRTKTLLLTAALSAAGIASSMAQVYSVNIVGYVQSVWQGNSTSQPFTMVATPLDDGNGNWLTNIGAVLPGQSTILVWDGVSSFIAHNKVVGTPPAFQADAIGVSLPPGIGYFVRNGKVGGTAAPDVTNTFVGTVVVNPGTSVTNPIGTGFQTYGSKIPIAGNLAIAGTPNGDPLLNFGGSITPGTGSRILTWNKPFPGGFTTALKPANWGSSAAVGVAEGWFGQNKTATPTNYVQSLP
jgi:hypothetical protein